MKVLVLALFLFICGSTFAFNDFPTTVRIEINGGIIEIYEAHTNELLFEYYKGEEEYRVFFETKIEADHVINFILEEDFINHEVHR